MGQWSDEHPARLALLAGVASLLLAACSTGPGASSGAAVTVSLRDDVDDLAADVGACRPEREIHDGEVFELVGSGPYDLVGPGYELRERGSIRVRLRLGGASRSRDLAPWAVQAPIDRVEVLSQGQYTDDTGLPDSLVLDERLHAAALQLQADGAQLYAHLSVAGRSLVDDDVDLPIEEGPDGIWRTDGRGAPWTAVFAAALPSGDVVYLGDCLRGATAALLAGYDRSDVVASRVIDLHGYLELVVAREPDVIDELEHPPPPPAPPSWADLDPMHRAVNDARALGMQIDGLHKRIVQLHLPPGWFDEHPRLIAGSYSSAGWGDGFAMSAQHATEGYLVFYVEGDGATIVVQARGGYDDPGVATLHLTDAQLDAQAVVEGGPTPADGLHLVEEQ